MPESGVVPAVEEEARGRVAAHGQELLEMLRRGRRFSEELLSENERLRFDLVLAEAEKIKVQNSLESEQTVSAQLRRRIEHLERRFAEVERENKDFASRYAEVSTENEGLSSLYVASYRLHSTLEPAEVTEIICEVMVELVGADEFALLLLDERTNELTPVRVEGPATAYPAHLQVGEGAIGAAVRRGAPVFDESAAAGQPLAIVPLQIKGHAVGALVITRMLRGRKTLSPIAREVLGLLAGHAATALMSSRLYTAVDRRLRTIEGFIDLMQTGPVRR
jgi:hypothetical protein